MEWGIQSILYSIIIYHSKLINFRKLKVSFKITKQLLKSSFPLLVSNLIIVLYIAIDDFFINYFMGNDANGVFSVVQFLVIFITWNIGGAFIYGLYPALAECYLDNKKLYKKRVVFIIKSVLFIGVFIGVFYTFFGNYIIDNYYNSEFHSAKLPLKIFAWAPLFIFLGMLFEKHLVNQNKLQRNVYRFVLGCLVNVLLCVLLIPTFKLLGAAIAVLLSHFVSNVGYVLYYRAYRKQILSIFGFKI